MEATSDDAGMDEIARGDEERRCEGGAARRGAARPSFFSRGAFIRSGTRTTPSGANRRERPRRPGRKSRGRSTTGTPGVDLFDSNVGETRLSDFILWGVCSAVLLFMEVLWPDFSFTDMCHAVWAYQRSARHAMDASAVSSRACAPRGGRQGGGRAKDEAGGGEEVAGRRWRGSTSAALDRSWRNAIEPRWRRLCARRKGPRWWGDGKKRPRARGTRPAMVGRRNDKFGRERRRRFETAKRCSYSRRVEPRWTTFERRASETHFRRARRCDRRASSSRS